jgi:hypothetical protein
MLNNKTINLLVVDTDLFLDLPLTTQALYFHLFIRSNNNGVIDNAKKIRDLVGANEIDMSLLISKGFLLKDKKDAYIIKT